VVFAVGKPRVSAAWDWSWQMSILRLGLQGVVEFPELEFALCNGNGTIGGRKKKSGLQTMPGVLQ